MKIAVRLLIIFLVIISSRTFSQKLKKSDRQTAQNLSGHIAVLSNANQKNAGSSDERTADNYIIEHWKKLGCKPAGDHGDWHQKFEIAGGKAIGPGSQFSVNGHPLQPMEEFFPFAFSANRKTEASVTMELAEKGVPWFLDIKELFEKLDSGLSHDTAAAIAGRARRAFAKGATALIVYGNPGAGELTFNGIDTMQRAEIPVIYVKRAAAEKYLLKQSGSLDVIINTDLQDFKIPGNNIDAFIDNHAAQTILITASLDNDSAVAELLELTRIVKSKPYRWANFLMAVFSPDRNGLSGRKYFEDHPLFPAQKVNYTLDLDQSVSRGLAAVQQSTDALNDYRKHEAQTRP